MTGAELVQLSLSLAGVCVSGAVWFRLGKLTGKTDALEPRVKNLENHVYLGGYRSWVK